MSITGIKAGMAAGLATLSIAAIGAAPALGAKATGDFDGNGVEDLAVGAPGEDIGPSGGSGISNAGAVDVFYGQPAGLREQGNDHWTQDRAGIQEKAEPGDHFGSSVAAGDINGDGFDDLAIGIPLEDVGPSSIGAAGAVQVLFGSPTGLTAAGNKFLVSDPETTDRFGSAVAIDDMFGGPAGDLAVGAPGENSNAGAVSRFQGASLTPFGVLLNGLGPGELAGTALATGQFGTQGGAGSGLVGKQDLAVGVPGATSGAGRVDVYRFNDIGSAFRQPLNEADLGRSIESGDQFGASLAAGNFGDGSLDDLAVGAPTEDIESSSAIDAGVVGVFYGKAGTLSTTVTDVWDQQNAGVGAIEPGDQFGAALATGNFGKTAPEDLAMGTPREDIGSGASASVDAGAVGFLYGDATNGLTSAGADSRVPFNFNYGPTAGAQLGAALAAGNFGSGARDDLAAGIPMFPQFSGFPQDSATGMVGVLYGRTDGISDGVSSPDLTLLDQSQAAGLGDDREGGDVFGAALAPSADRLIVGVP
jgi:hypothetical protein